MSVNTDVNTSQLHNFTHIAAVISLFTHNNSQSYRTTSHLYDLMIDKWICVRLRLRVERETTPTKYVVIIIIIIIIPYMALYVP